MPDPLPEERKQPEDLGVTARYVRGAREGSAEDLEHLYERMAPVLYVWLRGRIGRSLRVEIDVEDVMQEVWKRALAAFDTFDPARASFRSWILGIARMILLESMRKASARAVMLDTDGSSSTLSQVPDSVTTMTRAIARAEDVQRLLAHVDTLDEEDRTLLFGHGIEGETLADLATRLGISSDAARKRWQRLLVVLRKHDVGRDILGERWT